jgi:hypothetical protein
MADVWEIGWRSFSVFIHPREDWGQVLCRNTAEPSLRGSPWSALTAVMRRLVTGSPSAGPRCRCTTAMTVGWLVEKFLRRKSPAQQARQGLSMALSEAQGGMRHRSPFPLPEGRGGAAPWHGAVKAGLSPRKNLLLQRRRCTRYPSLWKDGSIATYDRRGSEMDHLPIPHGNATSPSA